MAGSVVIEDSSELDTAELTGVAMLVERATEAAGVRPLSEKVMADLLVGTNTDRRHIRLYLDDSLIGYANIDYSDHQRPAVEVAMDARADAVLAGGLLLDHLITTTGGDIQLWCHGPDADVPRLAVDRGFALRRTLIRMRRDLSGSLPTVRLPAHVRVRPFRVGQDEQEWLTVNSRAFADLPDQSGWDAADLAARLEAPWFDPDGFLLAVRTDDNTGAEDLVGFHWTKIHADGADAGEGTGADPVGEVYVLGIDPASQGSGLGKALTLLGLEHLRSRGLKSVMLYVEADNQAAVRTYERLGFRPYATDTLYTRLG